MIRRSRLMSARRVRHGELIALRWRDVDWSASKVRVRRSYTRGRFSSPKSKNSVRAVPMVDELGGILERLYQRSRWRRDDDLVFAHPATGGVIPPEHISRRMKKALRAAGLDATLVFRSLRHSFATRAAAVGTPMRTLRA